MSLRKGLSLAAIGSLMSFTAWAQAPSLEAGVAGSTDFAATEGMATVLYDQTDNAGANGAPDQDFEASFDAYDAEGADDFNVDWPDGWVIQQVNTVGTTGTPGGALVDVNVYSDNSGTPLGGSMVCSYNDVTPTTDNLGALTVDLPTDCNVPTGVHWLAIQVNQNFGTFGQHFWSNRTTQTGNAGHWRNPGDGFATGCLDWTPMTTCGVGGGVNPDFLFSIVGMLGEPQVPIIEVPTLGQIGLITLLLSLAVIGLLRMRRH